LNVTLLYGAGQTVVMMAQTLLSVMFNSPSSITRGISVVVIVVALALFYELWQICTQRVFNAQLPTS